ncbi:MAG: DUF58 domain-containing protein [Gammaproteobacteria bacterium]|nr:MAG: DUF58 domain-containing protein [Gammaproteobacteria bacterium]
MPARSAQQRLYQTIRIKLHSWFNARIERHGNSITLTGRSIYVIPTRYGFLLGFMLFVLLLSAMNYSNSLAFMLTFLLTGIAVLGMHYTYGNMVKLKIEAAPNSPVFAGQRAQMRLLLTPLNQRPRYGLVLGNSDEWQAPAPVEQARAPIDYQTPVLQRGRYRLPRTRIWTTFPFGLFYSWAWLTLDSEVLVYPKPQALLPQLPLHGGKSGQHSSPRKGDDDFAGIRRYQETDSPNRIAWKALAHSGELLAKDFHGSTDNTIWLDYQQLTALQVEQRLSQLCQWVLDCERDHLAYGLRLPGQVIDIDLGERHKQHCLRQLALFEVRP